MLIIAYLHEHSFFSCSDAQELLKEIDTPFLEVRALSKIYWVNQVENFLNQIATVLVSYKFHYGLVLQLMEMNKK